MSVTYSRESGSQFPDSLLNMNDFKDMDDTVKNLIMQYYQFLAEGNIDSAIAIKETNPELEDYWVDAARLNLLKEEIQNIGIYAKLLHGTVISDTEPTLDYAEGTYWIQPIE